MVNNNSFCFLLLYLCFFIVSCSNGRIKTNQVEMVTVYGIARGVEFSHGMRTIEDVRHNGRDTVILDKKVIRLIVDEINHLVVSRDSCSSDYRTAIILSLKKSKSVYVLLGEDHGILYNGVKMNDTQSFFNLVNEYVYSSHNNDYWFSDYSRSLSRRISLATHKAELVYKLMTTQRIDSYLLEVISSDYTDFSLMCEEITILFERFESSPYGSGGERLLNMLLYSDQVDRVALVEKITDLSSTAYLPSSQTGIVLQRIVRALLKDNVREIVACLNMKTQAENDRFWRFVFYGMTEQEIERETKAFLSSCGEGNEYLYVDTIVK